MGLIDEFTLRADLERDPGDLRRKRPEPDDHSVDGVFEIEDLAVGIDLDLFREVAEGDGLGDLGDRADLVCQVCGEFVHDTRELAPGPFDVQDERLPTEFSVPVCQQGSYIEASKYDYPSVPTSWLTRVTSFAN